MKAFQFILEEALATVRLAELTSELHDIRRHSLLIAGHAEIQSSVRIFPIFSVATPLLSRSFDQPLVPVSRSVSRRWSFGEGQALTLHVSSFFHSLHP